MEKLKMVILCCLVLLFSSSSQLMKQGAAIESLNFEQVENMLAEIEREFRSYRAELEEAAGELLQEQMHQLRRAKEQELFTASKELQLAMEQEGNAMQDQLGKELLNLQLQLVLVSLDSEQQAEKLRRVESIKAELEEWQEERAQVFAERLTALQGKKEKDFQRELRELEIEVERALREDLMEYSLAQNRALEQELGFLTFGLRR